MAKFVNLISKITNNQVTLIYNRYIIWTLIIQLILKNQSIMDTEAASAVNEFSKNSGKFAFELYNELIKDDSVKNLIMSPFSIQTCLALVFAGAKGKTSDELKNGLHLTTNDIKTVGEQFENVLNEYINNPILTIANKIYLAKNYELNSEYSNVIVRNFQSEIENCNFENALESSNKINEWVENKTNKKIKDLISPDMLDSDTSAVLINAIHFKGTWQEKFRPDETEKEDFWLNDKESIKTDMMNNKAYYDYGVFDNLDSTALLMRYKNSSLSMLIILPNQKNGIKALESKLQNVDLNGLISDMTNEEVIVKLPKFTAEFSAELNKPLQNLGMGTMFTNEADFGNLLKTNQPLKISKVVHKAFIEVNEEGTEAAAATGAVLVAYCAMIDPEPMKFYVDRPFFYAIVNDQDVLYFIGKYTGEN